MTKKIQLPRLEDDAVYSAAATRLAELRAEQAILRAKHESTLTSLNELAAGTSQAKFIDPLESAARRLIDGDNTPAESHGATVNKLRDEFGALSERLSILNRAVAIQQEQVKGLLNGASVRAAEIVRPMHRDLVRAIVKHLHSLDEALTAERDLRMNMEELGFLTTNIRAMPVNGHGFIRDQYSKVSRYLLECVEHGFLDKRELPEHLQAAIPPAPKAKNPLERIAADVDGWIGG